ncbi:MAG: tetratricopeptide repeat protein [Candidatus Contendobacter sp.]|nr:tetratricopeptide repeat protein [Candidatus Contendobacter sp.]MDG4556135.1 tetratricopeptide repeat protein [Candidatus Contendobacter sp.]
MAGGVGRVARMAAGLLLAGLTACGGPAPTPLQSQYQREAERALRYRARGELPRALAACQESLRWAEIADDRPGMLTQELNIGDLALALGDWALAERSFQRAQSMAAALSDATGALRARLGLAQISLRQGRFDEARLAFQQASDEARGRDVAAEVVALNGLGLTYRALGETSAGGAALAEAESLARAHGDWRLLAATLANRAALALRAGEVESAERSLEEAVDLDRAVENLPGLAHDLLLLAQVRRQQGRAPAAQELARRARVILQHTGQHPRPSGAAESPATGSVNPGARLRRAGLKSAKRNGSSN